MLATVPSESHRTPLQTVRVYPFGVARDRLTQLAKLMGVPAIFVKDAGEADVLVTLRSYYRDRQQAVMQAEQRENRATGALATRPGRRLDNLVRER